MSISTQIRDYILVYINGHRHEIRGDQVFLTLSDYLRNEQQLTGTKVVCAEGDCGACTVLAGSVAESPQLADLQFKAINACVTFMHLMDCAQIITIEALQEGVQLHPVQQALVTNQGTQCGFCTPGFVMSITGMLEQKSEFDEKNVCNYLTGNLCRCTGYQSIINSVMDVDVSQLRSIKSRFHSQQIHTDLQAASNTGVVIEHETHQFISPLTLKEACAALSENSGMKIFAAATDLGVQYNKGHFKQQQVLSLKLIESLNQIENGEAEIKIGARVNLARVQKELEDKIPAFAEFLDIFASPQIKNNGTLVGNIANGSPIGDSLPFLVASDAVLEICSVRGIREVNINDFYQGYKQFDLKPDEIITFVKIPYQAVAVAGEDRVLKLYKVSQRRDLDISCVSAAFKIHFDVADKVQKIAIAYGGVGPTVMRMTMIEQQLMGQTRQQLIAEAETTAANMSALLSPLSDVRGTDQFRIQLIKNLYLKCMHEIQTAEVA
ncbi:MAG: xanthine dehydrogenase small subunit [bacterium]